MKKALSSRISIFLSVDAHSVFKYYNSHDPAPLYNRQLSHELQEYFENSVASAKQSSSIRYKLICKKESDHKFINPVLLSIRRHFEKKRTIKEQEFIKFRKRTYILLLVSFLMVIILQGVVPFIFGSNYQIPSVFSNALDVFSFVILWKPIERLIFYWNPFKKDILLYRKMEMAESIVIVNEKEFAVKLQYNNAA
jgi:hypothetical protein